MKTRDDVMKSVNWAVPKKLMGAKSAGRSDVSVGVTKDVKANRCWVRFVFRNDVLDLILTESCNRIMLGILKNRIVFENSPSGYKPYKNASCANSPSGNYMYLKVRIPSEQFDEWAKFEGEYEFKLDEFYEYYYIQKED